MRLDSHQALAVKRLFEGTNVALVGPAGCGKSVVLRCVVVEGARRFGAEGVLVLAWAGSAAQLVQGRTVASLLKTTVGDPSKESILRRVEGDEGLLAEIQRVRLVVIDEAPTLQGRWMDRLEFVLRRTAPSLSAQCLPFGGRAVLGAFLFFPILCCVPSQVTVLSNCRPDVRRLADSCTSIPCLWLLVRMCLTGTAAGDPLQLPAFGVTRNSVEVCAYETRSWYDAFESAYGETVQLRGQHRQDPNDVLYAILMRIRVNAVTDADIAMLNSTWSSHGDTHDDHQHLRAVNADVNKVNDERLAALPGPGTTFVAVDTISVEHPRRREYAAQKLQTLAREVLEVKVDSQVVLTRAVGDVKTGARGTVVSISPGVSVSCRFLGVEDVVVVDPVEFELKDASEEILGKRVQLPLLLAWALTITRSQGMTLDRVAVDFSNPWCLDGMVYTALSRAPSFAALRVRGLRRFQIRTSSKGMDYYARLSQE